MIGVILELWVLHHYGLGSGEYASQLAKFAEAVRGAFDVRKLSRPALLARCLPNVDEALDAGL